MKKLFNYLLVLILFSSYSSAFIVGDWNFDDSNNDYLNNTANTVIDKSGNNITGTPFRSPKLTDVTLNGNGTSAYFNGPARSGSHIFIDHDKKMLLDSGKVSFFFKVDKLDYRWSDNRIGLLSKDAINTSASGDLTFYITKEGKEPYGAGDWPDNMDGSYLAVRLQMANGGNNSTYSYFTVPDLKIKEKVWYQIEFVFGSMDFGMQAILTEYNDGGSKVRSKTSTYGYYGGISDVYGKNNDSGKITTVPGTYETMSIGAKSWGDDRNTSDVNAYYTGWMDNLLFETYEDLVLVHYFDSCDLSKDDTLINYANNQEEGESSNSIVHGAGSQRTDEGFINKAIILKDKNNDYINLDMNQINKKSIYDFSIVVWIKTEEDGSIITTNNDDIHLSIKNNTIIAKVKGKEYTFDTVNILDNEWHQIILTRKVRKNANFTSGNYEEQEKIDAYIDTTHLGRFITTVIDYPEAVKPIQISWMHLGEGFTGVIDEFSLLRNKISQYTVPTVYKNHQSKKNWDGTLRKDPEICTLKFDGNITINDISLLEGDSGTTAFTFTVSLDANDSQNIISVDYTIAEDTATLADNDYQAHNGGTLEFLPGEMSKTITVNVNGDTRIEPNETFMVILSNVTHAFLGADSIGTGTIRNDDHATLSIDNIRQDEGDSGTTDFTFTATLDKVHSLEDITFDYQTSDGTALVSDSDYLAQNGSLTIPAGELSTTITIKVNGDTKVEPDETFNVELSNITHTTNQTATGVGTILNDDSTGLRIDDVTQEEGDSGTTDFIFTVSLKNPSSSIIHVDYNTSDITAFAIDDNDYLSSFGTLTFNPNDINQTITIKVNGDLKVEPDETFNVILSNADNNTSIDDGIGLGTILNDDNASLSINDISHDEGAAGTTTAFSFTVSLDANTSADITVDYAVTDSTATIADSDYQALANGTVTFQAGETSKTITVIVNGDDKVEPNETFHVILSNSNGPTIKKELGIGTITNDDNARLSINNFEHLEGHSGTTDFTFTVSLSNISTGTISVKYKSSDGTATTDDSDYQQQSGTVTFAPGENNQTITIKVNGDTTVEPDEIFNIILSEPSGATITDNTGTGTILNDDYSNVSIHDVNLTEGDAGNITPFIFEVSLDQRDIEDVTVDYRIDDGTASKDDDDYNGTITTGSITIPAGQLGSSITVDVIGDDKVERDETFYVILTGVTVNHIISDGNGTGTIINDDNATITISDVNLTEGDFGLKAFDFNVTMSSAHYENVEFSYFITEGTAKLDNNDYKDKNGTITFAPGDTVKQISIDVVGDLYIEDDETFYVTLVLHTDNAIVAKADGLGTIRNDDSGYPSDTITFNVERTTSYTDTVINSLERKAWYTQIAGRPFKYDVLSYETEEENPERFVREYPLSNVVVKVILLDDEDNTTNTQYHYFANNTARVHGSEFTLNDANKDSRFAIIYLTTTPATGGTYLIKSDCSAVDAETCYTDTYNDYKNQNLSIDTNRIDALDNFSIRPAALYYGIDDINATSPYIENSTNRPSSTRLIAGYDYNLTAQGLSYQSASTFVTKYTGDINATLMYSTRSGTSCIDDNSESYIIEGNTTTDMKHSQVGIYTLGLIDDTWTDVDNNSLGDCIKGKSTYSSDYNTQPGCNISSESNSNSVSNQTFGYVPARFDLSGITQRIRLTAVNIENNNTVYMNTLNGALSPMSIEIAGDVSALASDGTLTSNYTQGCMAQDIDFAFTLSALQTDDLNTTVNFDTLTTEDGTPQLLQYNFINTSPTNVVVVGSGNKTNITVPNVANTTETLGNGVTANNFDTAKSHITLNVNINRNRNQAMDPKRITFDSIDVASIEDSKNVHNLNITGQRLNVADITLLYARVRASQENYDANQPNFVRNTPIQIEVYCNDPIQGGSCIDGAGNPKHGLRIDETSSGWWLSTLRRTLNTATNINLTVTNNAFNLNDEDDANNNTINVSIPNSTIFLVNDTIANTNNANNNLVNTVCPNAIPDSTNVNAGASSAYVLYGADPLYTLDCRGASNWSGVGDESNVINAAGAGASAVNINPSSRLSW